MQAVGLLIMVLSIYGVVDQFLKHRKKAQQQALQEARRNSPEDEIPEVDPSVALEDLTSSDWKLRVAAIRQLGQNLQPDALSELVKCLDDSDSDVREAAVEAVPQYGTQATSLVLPYLEMSHSDTRTAAAKTLGNIGDTKALDGLHAALSDVSSWVRMAAANALGEIGSPESVEALAAALTDEENTIREAAADALRKINNKPAKEALKQYLERANHVSRRSR